MECWNTKESPTIFPTVLHYPRQIKSIGETVLTLFVRFTFLVVTVFFTNFHGTSWFLKVALVYFKIWYRHVQSASSLCSHLLLTCCGWPFFNQGGCLPGFPGVWFQSGQLRFHLGINDLLPRVYWIPNWPLQQEGTLQQNEETYPTKQEIRKIIDSKVPNGKGICYVSSQEPGMCHAYAHAPWVSKNDLTDKSHRFYEAEKPTCHLPPPSDIGPASHTKWSSWDLRILISVVQVTPPEI